MVPAVGKLSGRHSLSAFAEVTDRGLVLLPSVVEKLFVLLSTFARLQCRQRHTTRNLPASSERHERRHTLLGLEDQFYIYTRHARGLCRGIVASASGGLFVPRHAQP